MGNYINTYGSNSAHDNPYAEQQAGQNETSVTEEIVDAHLQEPEPASERENKTETPVFNKIQQETISNVIDKITTMYEDVNVPQVITKLFAKTMQNIKTGCTHKAVDDYINTTNTVTPGYFDNTTEGKIEYEVLYALDQMYWDLHREQPTEGNTESENGCPFHQKSPAKSYTIPQFNDVLDNFIAAERETK
jgi:hypothetical protein